MTPCWIVEQFYVVEHVVFCLGALPEYSELCCFLIYSQLEEAVQPLL